MCERRTFDTVFITTTIDEHFRSDLCTAVQEPLIRRRRGVSLGCKALVLHVCPLHKRSLSTSHPALDVLSKEGA